MQNHEHHDDLRKVLLDALLLVEYSFLSSESLGRLPAKHAKQVIVIKLIAYHEAIESFRCMFMIYDRVADNSCHCLSITLPYFCYAAGNIKTRKKSLPIWMPLLILVCLA